jgi:FkbM family methyltransferase
MKWFRKSSKIKVDGMHAALVTARDQWGIQPRMVIDVGAAQGKWSLMCEGIWPTAGFMLVEPLQENLESLAMLANSKPAWRHVAAAAGAAHGQVEFAVAPDLDGSGVYDRDRGFDTRTVPVVPLDSLLDHSDDCLLKLDTHGYEVPILEGSSELLKHVTLLVVEAYGQRLTSQSLLFHELCAYLDERGFRTAAVVDIMCRPCDGSFWQADFFFLRTDHPVFRSNSYQTPKS